jgi:hypothetical protein
MEADEEEEKETFLGVMAREDVSDLLSREMVSDHLHLCGAKTQVLLILRGDLVIKLNEALAPSHMSALVLNKFRLVFRCGIINEYLVILLINYYINADVGIP